MIDTGIFVFFEAGQLLAPEVAHIAGTDSGVMKGGGAMNCVRSTNCRRVCRTHMQRNAEEGGGSALFETSGKGSIAHICRTPVKVSEWKGK